MPSIHRPLCSSAGHLNHPYNHLRHVPLQNVHKNNKKRVISEVVIIQDGMATFDDNFSQFRLSPHPPPPPCHSFPPNPITHIYFPPPSADKGGGRSSTSPRPHRQPGHQQVICLLPSRPDNIHPPLPLPYFPSLFPFQSLISPLSSATMMVELIQNTNFSIQFVLDKINGGTGRRKAKQEEEEQEKEEGGGRGALLEGFEAENISEGSAFLSVILRLRLHWKKPSAGAHRAQDLPDSIIMKIPGPQHQKLTGDDGKMDNIMDEGEEEKEMTEFLVNAHQREIRFYQHFPRFDPGLRLPKFYFGSDYHPSHREGLILMEDLTPRGVPVPTLPGFSHGQVLDLVAEVARVHAVSWLFPEWRHKIGSTEVRSDFVEMMRQNALKLVELDPPSFGPLLDRLLPLFLPQYCALSNYDGAKFGFPSSIVHADLWAANVLWERDERGRPTDRLCAIIDWQCAHSGNPCEDLVRILSLNTSGQYRRENEATLLEYYAAKVAEFMGGGQAPFTMDQLKEAYRQTMPYCMMYLCFGAPYYHGMDSVVGTGPQREMNQRELLQRCRLFLEDTVRAVASL